MHVRAWVGVQAGVWSGLGEASWGGCGGEKPTLKLRSKDE